jgi:hypothetical protein
LMPASSSRAVGLSAVTFDIDFSSGAPVAVPGLIPRERAGLF